MREPAFRSFGALLVSKESIQTDPRALSVHKYIRM